MGEIYEYRPEFNGFTDELAKFVWEYWSVLPDETYVRDLSFEHGQCANEIIRDLYNALEGYSIGRRAYTKVVHAMGKCWIDEVSVQLEANTIGVWRNAVLSGFSSRSIKQIGEKTWETMQIMLQRGSDPTTGSE
jgi:hypothetical protein